MSEAVQIAALREAVELALPLLKEERAVWIECNSKLDDAGEPIDGTLDPECEQIVARYDAAIVQCAASLRASE